MVVVGVGVGVGDALEGVVAGPVCASAKLWALALPWAARDAADSSGEEVGGREAWVVECARVLGHIPSHTDRLLRLLSLRILLKWDGCCTWPA